MEKNKLDQIKEILGLSIKSEKKATFFEVAKLADGTAIGTTSDQPFATGDQIQVMQADGTLACAADGDYTIEDGRVLTVKDCTLANIADASAPAPVEESTEAVAQSTESTEENSPAPAPAVCECQNKFTAIEEKLSAMEAKYLDLETQFKSLNVVQEKMSAIVTVLADQPADTPIKRTSEQIITKSESKLVSDNSDVINRIVKSRNK